MSCQRNKRHRLLSAAVLALAATTSLTLAGAASLVLPIAAAAAPEPTKWVLAAHVGWNVDKTKVEAGAPQEERNECTTASKDECQIEFGVEATAPRGFLFPEGIAVSEQTGDVYVADTANDRVQVLDPQGAFLLTFGWNVNKTKVALGAGATQQEKNICTPASHDLCGAGESGSNLARGEVHPGQFLSEAIAIDPASGNVYVLDKQYHRVQEFTAAGEFVLMIGGEVNKHGGNICTQAEEAECQAGVEGAGKGAFQGIEETGYGNLMTVGPEGLLYVGDRGRVQKFESDGNWVGQIALTGESATGAVDGVAVDSAGDLFVVDSAVPGVHVYSQNGVQQPCVIDPSSTGIHGIALDAYQRLGVIDWEPSFHYHGALYATQGASCGDTVGGEIAPPSGAMALSPRGLAFSANSASEDRLYVAVAGANEVEVYAPAVFPEAATCPVAEVKSTSVVLCGEVNPNAVASKAFFKYGTDKTALVSRTATAFEGAGLAFEPFHLEVAGLTPNETYYAEAAAEAETEGRQEVAGGPPPVSFHTKTPAPEIIGEPRALIVKAQSAVVQEALNPEHAVTRYRFEYAACASEQQTFAECGERGGTDAQESSVYGQLQTVQELTDLRPATHYAFRLVAVNEFTGEAGPEGGTTIGTSEGHFTTAGLPAPQATTGPASAITATSATIVGTAETGGQSATYVFELGIYAGAATQYGVVFSGPVQAGEGPAGEELQLGGLQPATTYAYRIKVKGGYNEATGAAATFTTSGLPALLAPPPALTQLPVPPIAFPKAPAALRVKSATSAQKLAKALAICRKHGKPKARRVSCEKQARRQHAKSKKANDRKKG